MIMAWLPEEGWKMSDRRVGTMLLLAFCLALEGCAVVAVADAGITVAATAVKAGAKVVGAAVDAVTGSDDKKK